MKTEPKDVIERRKRREEDLAQIVSADDFLDLTPIWKKDAMFSIIIGSRCGGKSYGTLAKCIKDYKETGKRFCYVRRLKETITKKNIAELLDPFIVNEFLDKPLIKELWGDDYIIKYDTGKFLVVNTVDNSIEPECIGYVEALNTIATIKSKYSDAHNIYNVFLDEFLPLKSERAIKEEFDAWEQMLSTLCRSHIDQSKFYLVGNSITRYSEYLVNYGVDIKNMDQQGVIYEINLANGEGLPPTKVVFEQVPANEKLANKTSMAIRKSKMAVTGGYELEDVSGIPHVKNEKANEKLICTMFDSVMNTNLGFFLRTATWYTAEAKNNILHEVPHRRQFIVIRQTEKTSHFYHLTTVKGLSHNYWTDIDLMFKSIKEKLFIDIDDEIQHTRVYVENMWVGDSFFKTYAKYKRLSLEDLF